LSSRAALLVRLWRAEGAWALLARARDHGAEARRRRGFRRVALRELPAVPVLHVAATPPAPWLGGVPAQLGTRLGELERHRPTALLFPWRRGWRVEVVHGAERLAAELPAGAAPADEDGRWGAAVREVAAALRSRLLHVEGAAGLPHTTLAELAREQPLVLALHDFTLCCPRPNLFDERSGVACSPCADAATCAARLLAGGHAAAADAEEWRAQGAALFAAARCVVYSSEYLRRAHVELFGGAGRMWRTIAPGIHRSPLEPWRWPWTPRRRSARIAFLGGGGAHKGSALLAAVLAEWDRRGLPPVRWEVLGGGGGDQLRLLRRLPAVRVRGYYRHGTLPQRLRTGWFELALLLPQVPESFSLALSECWAAGVPVLALAQGALADRLAAGGGHPLPATAGRDEVIAAIQRWIVGELPLPPPPPPAPTAAAAAVAYTELFDELLAADGGAPGPP
jgi:glycosyltransferase involved in cell wall biosynthesis